MSSSNTFVPVDVINKDTPINTLLFNAMMHVINNSMVNPQEYDIISSTVTIDDIIIPTFNLKEDDYNEKSKITIIELLNDKRITYRDDIKITILLTFKEK